MRILILAPNVPYPATDGGKIVVLGTARAVSLRGHSVGFACLAERGSSVADSLRHDFPVWACEAPLASSTRGILANLRSTVPYTYSKHHPAGFRDVAMEAARTFSPDLVQVEFLHMGIWGLLLRQELGVPVLLRAHNVDSTMMRRFAASTRNPVTRTYARLQVARLLKYERHCLPQFDCRVAITPVDARVLSRISGAPTSSIPSGVDTDYFRPSGERPTPDTIVTVALMRWLPNVASTRWFVERVLPRVLRYRPGAKCTIIGRDPPSALRRHDDGRSVFVTGFVEDVRSIIDRSAVYVVPTRVGSGFRVKVVEALAMAKAVVATRLGCEGIDGLVDGEHLLLADGHRQFADAIVRLLEDHRLREALGRQGRDLVRRRYGWPSVAEQFEQVYRGILLRGTLPRPDARPGV